MNLIVSPAAFDDLRDIEEYIGLDNPTAAVAFVSGLTQRFNELVQFPGMGLALGVQIDSPATVSDFRDQFRSTGNVPIGGILRLPAAFRR